MNRQVKSKCCDAELKVSQADEGTCCFICTKCGKPSDIKVEVPMDAKLQTPNGVPTADCKVCGRKGGHIAKIPTDTSYIGGVNFDPDIKTLEERLATQKAEIITAIEAKYPNYVEDYHDEVEEIINLIKELK
jgi:hypothetical protein